MQKKVSNRVFHTIFAKQKLGYMFFSTEFKMYNNEKVIEFINFINYSNYGNKQSK
jgi:hypothetical protein